MSVITAKCLVSSGYASSSGASEYTAPTATHAIIDKYTAYNSDTASVDVSIHLIPSGGASDTTNLVTKATISAGAVKDFTEIQNQILNPGDSLWVLASTASKVVRRASGREVA